MRNILFLCLLSLFTCKLDFFETAKCVISKPKVQELGLKLFSYLYTKDYEKILQAILNSFSDLTTAVKDCLTDNDDDVALFKKPVRELCKESLDCIMLCRIRHRQHKDSGYSNCMDKCYDKYCKKKKTIYDVLNWN